MGREEARPGESIALAHHVRLLGGRERGTGEERPHHPRVAADGRAHLAVRWSPGEPHAEAGDGLLDRLPLRGLRRRGLRLGESGEQLVLLGGREGGDERGQVRHGNLLGNALPTLPRSVGADKEGHHNTLLGSSLAREYFL